MHWIGLKTLILRECGVIFRFWIVQVTTIQTLIITPLMYVGGVFNSIATLPGWAQRLSLANPMFYAVNAVRYGFLGISDVGCGKAVFMMSASGLILYVAAMKLMARGVGIRES